ncbi:MAG: tetratricopeptide repeat protein [Pseudomonadota bacterium]
MKKLSPINPFTVSLVALASILSIATPAIAQMDSVTAGEEPLIVDPMISARDAMARGDPAEALARYLRVLARDPGDLEALSGAGSAALAVGDADAAINFFVRAEKISPRDGRIKAGLGSALIQKEQPRAALRLFDNASDLGVSPVDIALDRGLAYDLRGDNRKAQLEYNLLLRTRPGEPEAVRRMALSLAMSGDKVGALTVLDPLLRKRDIAAWRARAFVLAMTGDAPGAEAAAYAVLPRYQADALKPFLSRLATLKAAEKAAAVHFGHFPEDKVPMEMAQVSSTPSTKVNPTPPSKGIPAPVVAAAASPSASRPRFDSNGRLVLRSDAGTAKAGSSAPVVAMTSAPEEPSPQRAAAQQKAADDRSLAEDRRAAQRKVAAEKAAAEKKAKAQEEAKARKSNPERYWVQIASGAYKPDLDKEWAKQKSSHGKLLAGKTPWTTPYKATNRLLIGPFPSKSAAQDYVNDARTSGLSSFPVTTSSGQKVDRIN